MSPNVVEHFSTLPDPRIDRHKKHEFIDLIVLSISAVISGVFFVILMILPWVQYTLIGNRIAVIHELRNKGMEIIARSWHNSRLASFL